VAGVIVIDYLFVRRGAYHDDREARRTAYVPPALIAWLVGAIVALLGAEGVVAVTGIAALDAIAIAAVAYLVLSRLGAHVPRVEGTP